MKKSLSLILLFMFISAALNAATYYVAINGSDSNPGTITQPWASWQKGFSSLAPGDILYIRGGNYTKMYGSGHGVSISNRDGSSSSKISVLAYPGETPVLDCASLSSSAGVNFGILMSGADYWYIKGLTVKNVREYNNLSKSAGGSPTAGWELSNCNNITLELCIVTTCGNGFTLNGTLKNINYLNCDAYKNYDYYDNGGLSNGFNGNMRGASTIFYKGCRSWSNSDDGYDNYGGAGYMTYNDCWAWRNGRDCPTSGNGDGFKLGPDGSKTELPGNQRTLYNCISVDNTLMGFDESMSFETSMDMALYNNISYKNLDYGFRFQKAFGTGVTTLKNNISYKDNIAYEGRSRNVFDHNSWNSGAPTISDADFVNLDMTQLTRLRKSDGSLPDTDFSRLRSTSKLIDAGIMIGLTFGGNAPDLGVFETSLTGTPAPAPVVVSYLNSKVESATPSVIGLTYSATLASIIPPVTSYSVKVNSVTRTISKLAISGTSVQITLASPVVNGDVVTVAYTKPATNPLQCMTGTQAVTISAQPVTNGLQPTVVSYKSSKIEDVTPAVIGVTYSAPLANITPPVSSYSVKVNSVTRTISKLAISGSSILITLASPVVYGDIVTVAYTKPTTYPVQCVGATQAVTITPQTAINGVQPKGTVTTDQPTSTNQIKIYPNPVREYINISSPEPGEGQYIKIFDRSGKLRFEQALVESTINRIPVNLEKGIYIINIMSGTVIKYAQKLVVI